MTEISTCQQPKDLFVIEVRYHKLCYHEYFRLPRSSENPAGRLSSKISLEIIHSAFEKMIVEIKDKFSFHSFAMSFLTLQRLAELTTIEDAVIENRVVKSLPIDKYDGGILFS